MKTALLSIPVWAALGGVALAEEKRSAEAHEHGHGVFQMVVEEDHAMIAVAVPAFDIVGFERAPSTPAQRATMAEAAAVLGRPGDLFALPEAAGCAIGNIDIAFGATGADEHDDDHGHEDHDEHEHGHKDDDHAGHDDHDHDHDHAKEDEHAGHDHAKEDDHAGHDHSDHDHAEEETHSEVSVSYYFACDDTGAIDRITFGYFDAFPNAEELEVVVLSDAGQSAGEVERDEAVFEIE